MIPRLRGALSPRWDLEKYAAGRFPHIGIWKNMQRGVYPTLGFGKICSGALSPGWDLEKYAAGHFPTLGFCKNMQLTGYIPPGLLRRASPLDAKPDLRPPMRRDAMHCVSTTPANRVERGTLEHNR
jgi:hypothetical protein